MEILATSLACHRGERLVFEDQSFRAAAGRALLVTGPNGAGKSTLLRVLARLLPLEFGALAWRSPAGDLTDPEDWQSNLHFLGHLDAIKPALTVRENLAFWSRILGPGALSGGLPPFKVEDALARLGIGSLLEVPARFLSAGQRRRLALSRLLVSPRPLWLLDEPTSALDDAGTATVAGLIAAHTQAGGMVIASTHLPLGLDQVDRLALRPVLPREAFA